MPYKNSANVFIKISLHSQNFRKYANMAYANYGWQEVTETLSDHLVSVIDISIYKKNKLKKYNRMSR